MSHIDSLESARAMIRHFRVVSRLIPYIQFSPPDNFAQMSNRVTWAMPPVELCQDYFAVVDAWPFVCQCSLYWFVRVFRMRSETSRLLYFIKRYTCYLYRRVVYRGSQCTCHPYLWFFITKTGPAFKFFANFRLHVSFFLFSMLKNVLSLWLNSYYKLLVFFDKLLILLELWLTQFDIGFDLWRFWAHFLYALMRSTWA